MSQDNQLVSWTLKGILDKALEKRRERITEPRDRIWASDLGKAYVDRYLNMTGVEPSNGPNKRTLVKFDMGSFFEKYLLDLLKKAGILQATQEYLTYQYPNLLQVTGRLDSLAGGKVNYKQARAYIKEWSELTGETVDEVTSRVPRWLEISNNLIDSMQEIFGDKELKTTIIELKTCSGYMMNVYEKINKPSLQHVLQLYHYLKVKKFKEGHLFYFSRDDGRTLDFPILQPSVTYEDLYKRDIETMTNYYKGGVQPPIESQVLFNSDLGKFQKNWKVE